MNSTSSNSIPLRGIVESFYGRPWSFEMHLDIFDFMKSHQLNAYIYAPKDDPYNRSKWREPYPEDQRHKLEKLNNSALISGIQFIFAVSPGLDLNFTGPKSGSDKQAMLSKLNMIYELGIRRFAIFFDDIPAKHAAGQAEFLNFIDENFIAAKDDVGPLIMSPTEYFLKNMAEDNEMTTAKEYTAVLSKELNDDIILLGTGLEICPDGLSAADIEKIHYFYPDRRIGIWWNYPVNDYMRAKPALGPLDKMTAAFDADAFFMNPMEREELSKIALATGADYALDPAHYDEEKSWSAALCELYGDLADDMRIFAGENQRLSNDWAHIGRCDDSTRKVLYAELEEATRKYSSSDNEESAEIMQLLSKLLEDTDKRLDAYKRLRSELPEKVLAECDEDLEFAIKCYSMEKEQLENTDSDDSKIIWRNCKKIIDVISVMKAEGESGEKDLNDYFHQIFGEDLKK